MRSMSGSRSRSAARGLLAALLLLTVEMGGALAQARFAYSQDGSEVTDNQTGLTWRRCSEGQSFSGGTCIGAAATFTHEAALVHARAQTGWRLPNVKELASIVDRTRLNPTIDIAAFPGTPFFHDVWSSSPYASEAGYAWYVDFFGGSVNFGYRLTHHAVRLVR